VTELRLSNGGVLTDSTHTTYSYEEWLAEARRRFGSTPGRWRFRCASCGDVCTPQDWQTAGEDGNRAMFECLGRAGTDTEVRTRAEKGECTYASFGLIRLSDCVVVLGEDGTGQMVMPFAEPEQPTAASA